MRVRRRHRTLDVVGLEQRRDHRGRRPFGRHVQDRRHRRRAALVAFTVVALAALGEVQQQRAAARHVQARRFRHRRLASGLGARRALLPTLADDDSERRLALGVAQHVGVLVECVKQRLGRAD